MDWILIAEFLRFAVPMTICFWLIVVAIIIFGGVIISEYLDKDIDKTIVKYFMTFKHPTGIFLVVIITLIVLAVHYPKAKLRATMLREKLQENVDHIHGFKTLK